MTWDAEKEVYEVLLDALESELETSRVVGVIMGTDDEYAYIEIRFSHELDEDESITVHEKIVQSAKSVLHLVTGEEPQTEMLDHDTVSHISTADVIVSFDLPHGLKRYTYVSIGGNVER